MEWQPAAMDLPWPLLWLIDPAGAYSARRTPRTRGPVFRQAAVFGPDVPGGSRQATGEEIAALRAESSRHATDDEAARQEVQRRWGSQLSSAARLLIGEGSVGFQIDGRSVDARIVRFWRGASLLETWTTGPSGRSESRTRISRHPQPDEVLEHLADAATG